MVVGMMADKALEEMVATLARMARPLVLTRAPGARAADPRHLADIARAVAPGTEVAGRARRRAGTRARVVARAAHRRGRLALSGRRSTGPPGPVDRINACGKVGLRCCDCSFSCVRAPLRSPSAPRLRRPRWVTASAPRNGPSIGWARITSSSSDRSRSTAAINPLRQTRSSCSPTRIGSSRPATSSSPRAPTASRPTASTTTPRRGLASSTTRRARRCSRTSRGRRRNARCSAPPSPTSTSTERRSRKSGARSTRSPAAASPPACSRRRAGSSRRVPCSSTWRNTPS